MNKQVSLGLLALVAACGKNPDSVNSSSGKEPQPSAVGLTAEQMTKPLPAVRGGPAAGKKSAALVPVAVFDGPAMPVGVAVSSTGRTFLSFPRWEDPVKDTVVELVNGKTTPFPDAATNAFDGTKPKENDPAAHFVSAQAIVFDEKDRLWVLDPGGFDFAPSLLHGPKLWAYDINTRERVKAIAFPNDVTMKSSTLNDVRFDLHRGAEGTAYITDSGVGGIIIVDLASGASWRHLDGDPSVLAKPGLATQTEGQPFLQRKKSGEIASPDFRSDGIALSPDGKTLYYNSVISHELYAVPTDLLANKGADEATIKSAVKVVAQKPSGNDGIVADGRGRIYTTDFEDNSLRRVDPATGTVEVIVQDERLIWPDTLALHGGDLYVTANQLARQSSYHAGKDERQGPYTLFKTKVE